MENKLQVIRLSGATPYGDAHRLQLERVEAVRQKKSVNTLYLLEHSPVITLGKNADVGGVLAAPEILQKAGVAVHRIERGGQATYHCPGQLVGYPIMDLHQLKLGVAAYVHRLEEVLIGICGAFGVAAVRREGLTGIFTPDGAKIGALGIRITRGISFHGFALNISPDLSGYNMIVPCGLTDTPMAKLAALVEVPPSMDEVENTAETVFREVFGFSEIE
ncbi:MAG: lipoyl(octanoyl) transferase LipB [Deltaproteobacteria bacterium]|nr:lipoyl(octanoyl) transferase LipB [Deltaproteobacteria bacterium]